jgi:hypothetical protein
MEVDRRHDLVGYAVEVDRRHWNLCTNYIDNLSEFRLREERLRLRLALLQRRVDFAPEAEITCDRHLVIP